MKGKRVLKRLLPLLFVLMMAVGLMAVMPMAVSAAESQTYYIVDPGDPRLTADPTHYLTWAQLNTAVGRLVNGDTLDMSEATPEAVAGGNTSRLLNLAGRIVTLKGDPAKEYTVLIQTNTDLTLDNFKTNVSRGHGINYTTGAESVTLTVIGDCALNSISNSSTFTHGLYADSRDLKAITITGGGNLYFGSVTHGIYLGNDYASVVTLTIEAGTNVVSEGINSGMNVQREATVNGGGSLVIRGKTGSNAHGIQFTPATGAVQAVTFDGLSNLEISATGSGNGFNNSLIYTEKITLNFKLPNDTVVSGGNNGGNGTWLSASQGSGGIEINNLGAGALTFQGGENGTTNSSGVGIYLAVGNNEIKLSGNTINAYGGGRGNGLSFPAITRLDLSGMNADFTAIGGPVGQEESNPWMCNGFYFTNASTPLTIKLGEHNFYASGGANGGAGILSSGAQNIVLSSEGGEIFAQGGNGLRGYGIYHTLNSVTGNGVITAQGGTGSEGLLVYDTQLALSGDVVLNVIGGTGAKAFTHRVNWDQNYRWYLSLNDDVSLFNITNNSAGAENVRLSRPAGLADLHWHVRESSGTYTEGSQEIALAAYSIPPGEAPNIKLDYPLESIDFTAFPEITEFIEGDALDLSGMLVTALYVNGKTRDVTEFAVSDPAAGSELSEAGEYEVTVSYIENNIEKSAVFVITVEHDWDEGVVTIPPTCTEDGELTITCLYCGEFYTEVVEAIGHDYIAVVTDPTCTEDGFTTNTCANCGDEYIDEVVPAIGHDYVSVLTDPTCTEDGFTTYTCSVCEDEYVADAVDALGHDHIAVITDPTCTEDGFTTYTCANCGDEYSDSVIPALGHTWDEGAVTTPATCEDAGVMTFTCSVCGDTYTEAIPAIGHDYKPTATDPTCTEDGFTTYTCSVCEDEYVADAVDALGHDHIAVVTDPTCTEDGFTTYTCANCGDEYTDNIVPALGHDWDEGAVTTPATCEDAGVMTFTCSICGDTYTEAIPAIGHDYKLTVTDPTCTEDGFTTYTCANCGDEYTDNIVPALGHDWDEGVITKPASEYEEGEITYTCNRCGDTRVEVIPATGHSHNYTSVITHPTCTEQGYTTYTCSCGDEYIDEYSFVPANGHDWDEGAVTTPATCEDAGVMTFTCSVCGDTYTEVVPATGHDYVSVITDPTCTEDGFTTYTCSVCEDEYVADVVDAIGHDHIAVVTYPTCTEGGFTTYTCANCGDEYTDNLVPALGHAWDEGAVTTPATCEDAGVMTFTCSVCGDTYTEAIPAIGHDYVSVLTDPTCTEDGFTTYTCANCGDEYTDNIVPALGHAWDEGAVTTPATCEDAGVMTFTCSVCGDIYTEAIPAIGHDYKLTVTDPTCETHGFTTYTCANCGDVYEDSVVPALGHVWDAGAVTTPATCTVDGVMTFTCAVCGETKTEVIPAGHDHVAAITAPTCTEQGYTTYTCAKCGDDYIDPASYKAALGHDWDEGVVTKPATEYEEGEITYTCGRCGDTRVESIPVTEHSHNYTSVITPPTCTEQGYTTYTCSCGESKVEDYTAALGHREDVGVVTVPPTETTTGVMTYYCTVCGEIVRTEIIPVLSPNTVTISGIELEFTIENGVIILEPTQAQMMAIFENSGKDIVFDLREFSNATIVFAASWFKDVDKTITIITANGSDTVKTKTLWNNSGKDRILEVRNGKASVKNA